jgi:rubredoxin
MNGPSTEAASTRMHETPGCCRRCGLVFDLHQAACPRCGRCPQCGFKKADGSDQCPKCGHPRDEAKFFKLAQELDPGLPSNQRLRRQFEESWQYSLQWERLNAWKVGVVTVPLTLSVLALILLAFRGWIQRPQWITMPFSLLFEFSLIRALVHQTRKGRFQWFVQKAHRNAANRQ